MQKNIFKFTLFVIFMAISAISNAHIGTGTAEGGGFIAGFTHPLCGLDHLLAMLAVGLWAGQSQGKTLWVAPLSFIAFMTIGGILGIFNLNLPMGEHLILMSLIVFGSLIALSIKSNVILAILIMGIFAIFHGHSHGTEMAVTSSAIKYTSGFVLATGMLHIIGIAIAKVLLLKDKIFFTRIAGSGIVATGIVLFLL